MSPARAETISFLPVVTLGANDNQPPDRPVDLWRCCIDRFKAKGLTALAVYTAKCKLRGNETFDAFTDRLLRFFEAAREGEISPPPGPTAGGGFLVSGLEGL